MSRPRGWLIILGVALALVTAVLMRGTSDPSGTLRHPDAAPRPDVVQRTLEAHADTLARNAKALRLRDLSLHYLGPRNAPDEQGEWRGDVRLRWRFDGFDRSVSESAIVSWLRERPDGSIEVIDLADTVASERVPVWLRGPVEATRTAQILVVGGAAIPNTRILALARQARLTVRRLLPGWDEPIVVEVPADGADLDRALGRPPGASRSVAAVTAPVGENTDAPVHVFLNPDRMSTLRDLGAQVVISHEVAHLATSAAGSPAPLWLVEGFADYVALRDVRLSRALKARTLLKEVRRSGVREALPDADSFETRGRRLGAAYEAAWLACVVLADAGGERALLSLYRDADRGVDLDRALRRRFGFGVAELTAQWRDLQRELASGRSAQ